MFEFFAGIVIGACLMLLISILYWHKLLRKNAAEFSTINYFYSE